MKKLEKSIKDVLIEYLKDNDDCKISIKTVFLLNDIINGKLNNYIVMENGGGTLIHIIPSDNQLDIESLINDEEGIIFKYTYLVCINNESYFNDQCRLFYRIKPYLDIKIQ